MSCRDVCSDETQTESYAGSPTDLYQLIYVSDVASLEIV